MNDFSAVFAKAKAAGLAAGAKALPVPMVVSEANFDGSKKAKAGRDDWLGLRGYFS